MTVFTNSIPELKITKTNQTMTERNPNTVGQIYRIPEDTNHTDMEYTRNRYSYKRLLPGDLIVCLKHTGDCHYDWALLNHTTRTSSPNYTLPEKVIKNYYDAIDIFIGYSFPQAWAILAEPLTYERMLGIMIAMNKSSTTGLLLPLFPDERAEYLRNQKRSKKEAEDEMNRVMNPQQDLDAGEDDEWPKLKS